MGWYSALVFVGNQGDTARWGPCDWRLPCAWWAPLVVGRYRIVDEARVLAAEVVLEMGSRCCSWARSPGCWCRPRVWTVRFQQSRTLNHLKSSKVPGFLRTEDQGVGPLQARIVGGR